MSGKRFNSFIKWEKMWVMDAGPQSITNSLGYPKYLLFLLRLQIELLISLKNLPQSENYNWINTLMENDVIVTSHKLVLMRNSKSFKNRQATDLSMKFLFESNKIIANFKLISYSFTREIPNSFCFPKLLLTYQSYNPEELIYTINITKGVPLSLLYTPNTQTLFLALNI